ncbi:FAD-dependent oxidoreductase, partial [Rhizobium leguminosarum]|uniref:FAD-dependent oxidoreductase n=1 Tax=Rhizobium leguminosarum TaxID=384 RepID=UPI003F9C31F8
SRPVCYPEHGFYLVPMADGLRAAGTVELGGLAAPLTPRRTAMIRDGVKMLLSAAGHGSDEWIGFRPSMPDSLPVIGSSLHLPRVTYAFLEPVWTQGGQIDSRPLSRNQLGNQ